MRLGLIAGNRQYPIIFAREAKKEGVYLVATAFRGETRPCLRRYVDELQWVTVGQLDKMIEVFRSAGITEAVMVGQISPKRLFRKMKLDKRAQKILADIGQMSAETIFSRIAEELAREGIVLKDARIFMGKTLAELGSITLSGPSDLEMEDINFGKDIVRGLGNLNIGQTVVIKNKTVVAVEAIAGTDYTIRRGGRIGRGNTVVIKMSKPGQDMRFDVPVVGPGTIKVLNRAGGGVLALEAGRVIILDKSKTIQLAEKYGIKIIGI